MAAAQRSAPTDPLFGDSKRPGEPLTAGMRIGAGPGPEVLRTGSRAARTFRQLAQVTGNARFAELAELAAQRAR